MTAPARAAIAFALLPLAFALAVGCGGDSESDGSGDDRAEKVAGGWTLGGWQGELRQKGLRPFEVWSTVRSLRGADGNRVRYSGLDCRGRWTPLGGDGAVYRFREEITSGGGGRCKGVGIVTLRRRGDDEVGYSFRGGGVESRGTLTRRAGS